MQDLQNSEDFVQQLAQNPQLLMQLMQARANAGAAAPTPAPATVTLAQQGEQDTRKAKKCRREKQRRLEINEKFEALRTLLQFGSSKVDKTTILTEAIKVITQLAFEISDVKSHIAQMVRRSEAHLKTLDASKTLDSSSDKKTNEEGKEAADGKEAKKTGEEDKKESKETDESTSSSSSSAEVKAEASVTAPTTDEQPGAPKDDPLSALAASAAAAEVMDDTKTTSQRSKRKRNSQRTTQGEGSATPEESKPASAEGETAQEQPAQKKQKVEEAN